MKDKNKSELVKWRWLVLAVTVLGVVFFSLPWIPARNKYPLAIPLYAALVYVYYRYLCIRKQG